MKKIKNFKSWLKDEIVTLDFSEWWILTFSIFLLVIVIFTKVINVVLPDNFVMEFFFAVLTAIVSSFVYIWFEDDRADTLLKMRVLKKGKSLEKLNDLECDLDDRKQELLSRLKTEPADSFFFEDAEVRLAKIQEYIKKTEHEIEVTTNKINKTISRY